MPRALGYSTGIDRLQLIVAAVVGGAVRFFAPRYMGAHYYGTDYFR